MFKRLAIASLLMVSPAFAGIKVTPASLPSGAASPTTLMLELENTTASPLSFSNIGPVSFEVLANTSPTSTGGPVTIVPSATQALGLDGFVYPLDGKAPFSHSSSVVLPGGGSLPQTGVTTDFRSTGLGTSVIVQPGSSIPFATLDVSIPVGFLGSFELVLGNAVRVVDIFGSTDMEVVPQGGLTSTVTVPEPSSFLFLGLVGVGAIGFRRFRKRNAVAA